ncbi:hypothetical protein O6H91_11G047400 [Diphasiastrum complanatum]|uniref:Uncharacterized protein n=3 Tax=Diphasiastrum complanatum TaxID=34168 RepID=A0ACC2C8T9_DIPCM|nr:hypothetical protein O6H91_11G047400 [Diphasiastrum complanatum]KAJ7538428.1 hypothetical protein O6H91_11G047400 [Diphasiastrum complanatum]KAJ7538429.1 hypothetical protein O6H91_11G047400 [Diphasiastrum complanatum]
MMSSHSLTWCHQGIASKANASQFKAAGAAHDHLFVICSPSLCKGQRFVQLTVGASSVVELTGQGYTQSNIYGRQERCVQILASSSSAENGDVRQRVVKGATLGARARRLERVRHEKIRRQEQEKQTYPEWALILEKSCKDDAELREILGDSIGNPEAMQKRLQERVLRKGRDVLQSRSGSAVPIIVSFRDFDPFNSYIWLELYASPSDKETDILGRVIQAWYILGRLGAFNSMNLQLTNAQPSESPFYSTESATEALPAFFHNIGNLEFQDNWARLWVDLGTSDPLALDVIINSLTALSSQHVGIKQLIFGGKNFGDWEEGMTNPEDGYKVYKI